MAAHSIRVYDETLQHEMVVKMTISLGPPGAWRVARRSTIIDRTGPVESPRVVAPSMALTPAQDVSNDKLPLEINHVFGSTRRQPLSGLNGRDCGPLRITLLRAEGVPSEVTNQAKIEASDAGS
jgi:hypothetical protein